MNNRDSKLKRFVINAYSKIKASKLPKFSNKYSPKRYTQHQLCAIVILKKRLRTSYRDLMEFLIEMPKIRRIIDLQTVPHYTTIQKFFQRIGEHKLVSMIDVYACRIVAIDSTGIHSYASKHYEFVVRTRRPFQKLAIAVDTDTQRIIGIYTTNGHENPQISKTYLGRQINFVYLSVITKTSFPY